MSEQTLLERINLASEKAAALVPEMLSPSVSLDRFTSLVFQYLRYKFMLEEDECPSDNILELCDASVEKLLYAHDKSVELGAASATCTGISSSATKKVLLILALQRELGIEPMPADVSVRLQTVPQLASRLLGALEERRQAQAPVN